MSLQESVQGRIRGASLTVDQTAGGLAWCLPAPSAAATLGLRLTWLALLALSLTWLVSLCFDAEQGRVPLWSAVLGLLVVGAWALATRSWLIAALRVPTLGLRWREATRERSASWFDAQGQRVKVDVLIDLGFGMLVQCRWQVDASNAHGVASTGVVTRWVPASAVTLEVRWRLFHARHEAVASSGLNSPETKHVPQRQKGSMSASSSSTTPRRKGQL